MHDVNHALTVIKEKLGMSELSLNADGQVEINFADGFAAYVTQLDQTTLELSFRLPDLAYASPEMMRAMLVANFLGTTTGPGRLAIDPLKEEVIYCERWDVTDVDARNIERKFADFIVLGTFWRTEGGDAIIAAADKDKSSSADLSIDDDADDYDFDEGTDAIVLPIAAEPADPRDGMMIRL